jgi:hypothetical protein
MNRLRFSEALWLPDGSGITGYKEVVVGGAGGIGSWLTLFLNRAGFFVNIFDFDTIEAHNLGGQFYPRTVLGRFKVDALRSIIADFGQSSFLNTNCEAVTEDSFMTPIAFSAFDNMQARKDMFSNWLDFLSGATAEEQERAIFIDGRLEMEQLQIFCVKYIPSHIKAYREQLFDDSRVADAPCSMRQTSHTAAMIASLMTSFLTNHMANLKVAFEFREVPFFHEYVVPNNYTQTKQKPEDEYQTELSDILDISTE